MTTPFTEGGKIRIDRKGCLFIARRVSLRTTLRGGRQRFRRRRVRKPSPGSRGPPPEKATRTAQASSPLKGLRAPPSPQKVDLAKGLHSQKKNVVKNNPRGGGPPYESLFPIIICGVIVRGKKEALPLVLEQNSPVQQKGLPTTDVGVVKSIPTGQNALCASQRR